MLIVTLLTAVFVVVDAPLASKYVKEKAVMLSATVALEPVLFNVRVMSPVELSKE
jgi:hypothetical protein